MPDRKNPPCIEGLRFRAFLEQLCAEIAPDRDKSDKGVQALVRELFGLRPDGKEVLGQSQCSQYLRDINPKYAQEPTVARFMAAYEKVNRQRVRPEFFNDRSLKDPKYKDFLEPLGSTKSAPAAALAPTPTREPATQQAATLRILEFLEKKRDVSPAEIRKFKLELASNGIAENPTDREMEIVFSGIVRRRNPSERAAASRNLQSRSEREGMAGGEVRKKPRPEKRTKKPRSAGKRKPPQSPDATA